MMNQYSLKLANYWRTSLADAENGKGALQAAQVATLTPLSVDALLQGCVSTEILEALFAGEPAELPSVEVTLRPLVYNPRLEHGKARTGTAAAVTPVVSQVLVTRDGRLYPTANTLVPRDILEPQANGALVVGAQIELDAFLSRHEVPVFEPAGEGEAPSAVEHAKQWNAYLQFCAKMFQHVGCDWQFAEDGFQVADHAYLFKESNPTGFTQHILPLYDHLRTNKPDVALFERFAQREASRDEPCLAANSQFAARLAHAGDRYALAPAQRDALGHLLASRDGDVLAVNGPPGTGKTTLLLSVVASLWARAALAGGEPPVIVASSTNNQAVTNIIKAFGKDFATGSGPFAGRWLPDIDSFGAYFPSFSKEAEMARSYQTKSFFEQRETEQYLAQAQEAYIAAGVIAFPDAGSVASIADKLQGAIRHKQQQLLKIEQTWASLERARQDLIDLLGETPYTALAQLQARHVELSAQLAQAQAHERQFKQYLAHEPLLYSLFGWLPPVANKRLRLAKLQLDQNAPAVQNAGSVSDIEQLLNLAVAQAAQAVQDLDAQVQHAQLLVKTEQQRTAEWDRSLAPLPRPANTPAEAVRLSDCDAWADTSLRFEVFLLTTHYWEGRWLLEVGATLKEILDGRKKNGRKALAKNWHRWMKLTPCVVATFFMLPKEMACTGKDYAKGYALNFIDLLIVDEAGQVLPEVAAPAFALAKQALVIGDTLQIEPIWSIPEAVDIGNLIGADVLTRDHDIDDAYEAFRASGRSAGNGSVMAIAQSASRYHYDPDMARGMFLYEHRRCYNTIIEYCNALCYKGKLIPSRPDQPKPGLPPLGYLHVDGRCEPGNGGSRHNLLEAATIAAWIQANAADLLARYDGKLKLWEILGIITPFGAQTQAISQACDALGLKTGKGDGEITVGTVHSFQGAERPVVIFSAVYSKHADGGFIDRRDSMLNVAVSRAKASFLVFGDMDLFGQVPANKPRGLLAEFLLRDPASELTFDYQPRQDLHTARTGLEHLHQAHEHDCFLAATLQTARQQVQIVTPWVKLHWMEKSGAMAEMAASVARGVQVVVYTDFGFNTDVSRDKPQGDPAKVAEFRVAIEALRALNVQALVVNKVHSKIVMADEELLCIGSFNWLSASRSHKWMNHETSMVYRGPDVTGELVTHRASLAARVMTRR